MTGLTTLLPVEMLNLFHVPGLMGIASQVESGIKAAMNETASASKSPKPDTSER